MRWPVQVQATRQLPGHPQGLGTLPMALLAHLDPGPGVPEPPPEQLHLNSTDSKRTIFQLKTSGGLGGVAHACNPSYTGG